MNSAVKVSLIMPYRGREAHLKTQVAWWQQQPHQLLNAFEVLLIEVSETPSDWILSAVHQTNFRYIHCPCEGTFHKTKALNLGLSMAYGNYVVPYDVDLIPVGDTLRRQLWVAEESRRLLITGYRLMCDRQTITLDQIPAVIEQSSTAPEDQPTALWKHLTRHEKFGVVPFFRRDRLVEIGGWDEHFVGWGAEDQDLIERYLQTGYMLCRCPELLYLHLFHGRDPDWSESQLVEQNRRYYYTKVSSDS
jgi:predicted glycosyltransferase involved in capsule biosynthesis